VIPGETVLSGADHPGTDLMVHSSVNGYYIGFRDKDGMPYSRETCYFDHREDAEVILELLRR